MNTPMQQTSVAVATKTKVGVGLTTKLAVSLGVLGATAAFAAAAMPGASDDGGALFARRAVVTVATSGSGSVSSSPAGIACPGQCSTPFPVGATVILNARPQAGAMFADWSGACQGDGGCSFVVGRGTRVQAAFQDRLPTALLTVSATGSGRVVSNPGGIACGADCSEAYPRGTTVTLTAVPAAGMLFAGWGGVCSGGASVCVVTVNENAAATARFIANTGS